MEQGYSANAAAEKSIDKLKKETGGFGGIIIIDKTGDIGYAFNSGNMAWASISPNGLKYGK